MKSYPYIGEGKSSGSIALIYDEGKCITLKSKTWASGDLELCEGIKEECFKNITSKHLERKCVEIKSKEHGHFIQQLAFNANYLWSGLSSEKRDISSGYLVFGRQSTIISLKTTKPSTAHESVTIPLPPESITNTPKESKVQKLNSVTHHKLKAEADEHILIKPSAIDFEVHDNLNLSFNTTESVSINGDKKLLITVTTNEPEENAGINLIFGDADKCKKWPCVGSKVTWGNCSYTAEVIAIHSNMAWVFTEGEYHTEIAVSKLQKPKTPEEELRELLSLLWKENNHDFDMFLDVVISHVTKKPQ